MGHTTGRALCLTTSKVCLAHVPAYCAYTIEEVLQTHACTGLVTHDWEWWCRAPEHSNRSSRICAVPIKVLARARPAPPCILWVPTISHQIAGMVLANGWTFTQVNPTALP